MTQDEALRVVDFTRTGGRPFGVLNLEDGQFYSKLKGTLAVVPGERATTFARQPGRYGGSRAVDDRKENAALQWTAMVIGASEDDALAKAGALLSELEHLVVGRKVEFRARGATYPTYLDVRGPGSARPVYDPELLTQQNAFPVELSVPVAPLGELPAMDVLDDFAVDSVGDYAFDAGAGTLSVSGGQLVPSSTALKRLYHSARGYRYADVQVTVKWTPGTTITGVKGPIIKRLGPNDYIYLSLSPGSNTGIQKVDGGAETSLAGGGGVPALTTGVAVWLRLRSEGNVVTAEVFYGQPTPMGAPDQTVTATLAGADATKFGAGVAGDVGLRWTPGDTTERTDDFEALSYTYRNQTLPKQIQLGGAIPGDAPALADIRLTPSGGAAAPVWALIGWTPRPGTPLAGSVVPFGLIQAEAANTLTTWAAAADANYRSGNGIKVTTSGAGTASAEWVVDPAALTPDPFALLELDLEVFVRVELASGVVSPKLTLSAKPDAGTNFGAQRYASPFESSGKLLVKPSSGTVFRLVRLGIVTVVCDPRNLVKWRLRLDGSWAASSVGVFGIDELVVEVARARAAGLTGRANDPTSYPRFVASTAETQKTVRSDLSGLAASPPNPAFPDSGLDGEPIEPPPGLVDVLVKLSSLVPDDPTTDTTSEQKEHSATFHMAVTPRTNLLRGA